MMRYQRVSPDCLPLSNGKKPNLRAAASSVSKDDNSNSNGENGRTVPNGGFNSTTTSTCTSFDAGAKGLRFRSPSRAQDPHNNSNNNLSHSGGSCAPTSPNLPSENNHHENPKNHNNQTQRRDTSPSPSRGDVLLQWGHKKRSRVSRAEIRSVTVTDDSSSSSAQGKHPMNNTTSKLPRRVLNATMPPPPPPLPSGATSNNNSSRASNLRNGLLGGKETSGFISSRNLEERPATANGSPSRNSANSSRAVSRSAAGKRSSSSPDKFDRKMSCPGSAKDEKQNGSIAQADRVNHSDSATVQSEQEAMASNTPLVAGGVEKVNVEVIEWPRIYLALSRKEKEDDFLAMKGTKLPHRPKKRAKNIDKALQYCFPGMWLSDLTKSRYEVREKKCVKKQKRRGLKGMESMESDSE